MKVAFVDFDGVLNSRAFLNSLSPGDRGRVLDPSAVARLNRLLSVTGAQVVVSSSWRYGQTRTELCDVLYAAGLVGTVRGKTPEHVACVNNEGRPCRQTRGDEINAWLKNAASYGLDIEGFVILDDDEETAPLTANHVMTSFEEGLLDHHIDTAIAVLSGAVPLLVAPSTVELQRYAP